MQSSHYRMADRLTGGNLAEVLAKLTSDGCSKEAICRQLYAEYGIEVSGPTLREWLAQVAA